MLIVAALVERYRIRPPPATLRLIVFPMVAWFYLGGAVVLLGGLIALWPSVGARRRRLRTRYAARLGREVSGAQDSLRVLR
ncbi:MAG: hypothetical protein ACR2NV_06145 [Thermoleophilaceae bacterium]